MNSSSVAQSDRLAFIYVIDPPGLTSISAPLLLSIRRHHPNAKVFPYCPMGRRDQIPDRVLQFHEDLNAPIVEMTRPSEFAIRNDRPYRQGNKLLAAAERRDTEFCIFLDTDTYLARPLDDPRLFQADKVASVPESVAGYASRFIDVWDKTYAVFGMQTPSERVKMLRSGRLHPPYFNAGFLSFPETTPNGSRFGEVWLDTAMKIDFDESLDHDRKRPWLDQAAMPIAIYRSGCNFEAMEHWFNYPLDASFLPRPEVRLYHYHSLDRIEAADHFSEIEDLVVSSGYFRSLEHYLTPLKESASRKAALMAKVFEAAGQRRQLAQQIKKLDSKPAQRPLKDEIRRLKGVDAELRRKRREILQQNFYDDDWMVRR